MKVKELKKRLDTCNDDLEIKVIRDGDIPGSEEHTVNGAYVICEATENLEYLNAFYLVWDEA
ncbi:hypothetical protein LI142_08300 [Eubacterium limosum]|uniref:hypothetical protein n=1 Tax=Eubacterium limosum TaxID=1736 RepID=UPI001D080B16|nr:hypothetical protein [Eubacterium limosum]MCB6569500.1 hypothetical protein [Eubacterium limosum]